MPLPEECLWLIIFYLRYERATLHSLLLASRTLFRISVSFLYASPFRLLHNEPNLHWTVVEKTRRYDRLLHLLISSSSLLQEDNQSTSSETRPNKPRAPSKLPTYGPEASQLPSPATVNYLRYYTDMFHYPMMHETFMTLFPTIPNCYHDDVVWYRSMVEIHNRIELAMLDRLAPQLLTLTITLPMQVPRIKLPWLSSIRRLEILGTEKGLYTDFHLETEKSIVLGNPPRPTANRSAMSRLDKMLTFIQDHQRRFGTLRELQIDNKIVFPSKQPGSRLIELVEAMGDNLEVLDVRHWPEAVFYLDRIPVQNLRTLFLHTLKQPEQVLQVSGSMSTFLNSCPKLQEISMYVNTKDTFEAWRPERFVAVHTAEQRRQDALGPKSMTSLTRIELAGLAEDVIVVVNEAAELFGPTLEHLTVRSWFNGKLMTTPLSWTSSLARLESLDLEGEVAWTFDYTSLLNCTTLSKIRLAFTGPVPSRSLKKQPAIDILTRIFGLQKLDLVGKWETLSNRGWTSVINRMHQLERLDLVGCEGLQAEQVAHLVKELFAESERWQLNNEMQRVDLGQDGDGLPLSSDSLVYQHYYGQSRLRWVIVSKHLEDAILRCWHAYGRTMGLYSPFVRSSFERVRFTYVSLARPSR
ncbi:hypothetical protein BG006_009019 [Podila minutissima]|uniref:Uncharacterized protein n=1 Tax=Podila minutissima TaxID=64525 RepID=A0A9P5VJR2_9FUNG|nr:hypothetical protein BG006_009019 [Podila minutissima]